jgi:cation diffusion facilitator family transporter
MSSTGGTKAVLAAMFANGAIAVAKFVAFAVTGSASMLAEGVHSVADTGNQALLLLGGRRARRAATPEHPFGYGRERYVYAFIVSIVLFSLGGVFALYEGFHKIEDPHPLDSPQWAFGVLIFAIVAEFFSFRTAIREARPHLAGRSWWRFIRTSKAPELPVVLLEDLGALIGLFLALGGVSMAVVTDNGVWDGIGSLCIGTLLVIIAVILGIEMKSLLIGEAADPASASTIASVLVDGTSITRVIHLRTLHLGPDELLVGAKIAVAPGSSATDIGAAIDAAEARIRAAVPIARVIYLEPDLYDAERGPSGPGTTDGTDSDTTNGVQHAQKEHG